MHEGAGLKQPKFVPELKEIMKMKCASRCMLMISEDDEVELME